MHGASCGNDQVMGEENSSGDPAGRHPQLPCLPWDLLQEFQNINGKEIQQLSSICPCETPELMFPASPSQSPLQVLADKPSYVCSENKVDGRAGGVLLRMPGARVAQLGAQKKRRQQQLSFSSFREPQGDGSYRPLALFNLSAIFLFSLLF